MIFTALLSALVMAATSIAAPLAMTDLDLMIVYNPHITYPTPGAVWPIGSTPQVTWNTSDIPPEAVNTIGVILLGHSGNNSENLDIDHPLATNFLLRDGHVPVYISSLIPPRKDYFLVLFGDSGNMSPVFEISGC